MRPDAARPAAVAALRTLIRGVAPLLLALAVGTVAIANGPAETVMRVTLTGTAPEARVGFDAAALAARPRVLVVEIIDITNPGDEAVGIQVDLTWAESDAQVRIGSFAPFPADMTGRYLLGTQRALETVRETRLEQPALVFRLTPVHGDLSADFRVALKAAWRQGAGNAGP